MELPTLLGRGPADNHHDGTENAKRDQSEDTKHVSHHDETEDTKSACFEQMDISTPVSIHNIPDFQHLVTTMKSMTSKQDLLRSVNAGVALRCFGQLFWTRQNRCLYHLSSKADEIDEFWSHSWHGRAWHKIAALMVLNNGPASLAVGSCAALAAMMLSCLGILPHFAQGKWVDGMYPCGTWSLISGTVSSGVVYCLWKSQRRVFFDRVCIHQNDPLLKTQGIINLGLFLKKSRCMLVLWDPSYVKRLWCIFELAAFLHSQKSEFAVSSNSGSGATSGSSVNTVTKTKCLVIRPVLLGPCTLAVYALTVCVPIFHKVKSGIMQHMTWTHGNMVFMCLLLLPTALAIHVMRGYQRSVELMKTQLKQFSVQKAECSCCAMGHVDLETGERTVCDRKVVEACIRSWFGSLHAFEAYVRSSLGTSFEHHLGSRHAFSYQWVICASCPFIWGQMDTLVPRVQEGDMQTIVVWLLAELTLVLGTYPLHFACICRVARILRKQRSSQARDLLVSANAAAVVLVMFGTLLTLMRVCILFFDNDLLAIGIYLSIIGPMTLAVWFGWE